MISSTQVAVSLLGFSTPKIQSGNNFLIEHYAGQVSYAADEFLERNIDQLRDEIMDVLQNSSSETIRNFFPATNTTTPSKIWTSTVVKTFTTQMSSLMRTITSTTPVYIRCIRPNSTSLPDTFDVVLSQNKSKLMALCKGHVMRHGYTHRTRQTVYAIFRAAYECVRS